MSGQFWLGDEQVERLRPPFPKLRSTPRVDDQRVLSGILFVLRNGLALAGRPGHLRAAQDAVQPLCALVAPWGVCQDLPRPGQAWPRRGHDHDGQHTPQGSPHGGQPQKRGLRPRAIGRTKGDLNSKLHMVSDDKGRPLTFFLSPGQMSDAKGALVLLAALPRAKRLLGDKGYRASVRHRSKGAGEGRLAAGRTESPKRPCLHSGPQRTEPPCQLQPQTPQEASSHRKRLRTPERLERHRHAAHTRCGDLFLSAIALAAAIIFWLG